MPQDTTLLPFVENLATRSPLSSDDETALLALPHSVEQVQRHRAVSRQGESKGQCHVLLTGWAYSAKATRDGSRAILGIHMSGDLLDVTGSCNGGTYDVCALTNVTIASIPRDALMGLAALSPAIATALWMLSARNASVLGEWVLNVARRDARGRLAHRLCEIAARQEAAGIDVRHGYVLPLTQEQLADSIGLTPVHLNRVLQTLRRDKLVECANGYIRINNWAALAAEGDFDPGYLQLPARESIRQAAFG